MAMPTVASNKVKGALSADGRTVLPPMSVKAAGDIYRTEITRYTKMLNELNELKDTKSIDTS